MLTESRRPERADIVGAHTKEQYSNLELFANLDAELFDVNKLETALHIIRSSAHFQNMKDKYQFALVYEDDTQVHNRQSHSLLVEEIAGRIAEKMGLGPKGVLLSKLLALVHDIGHIAFSHRGEVALQKASAKYGISFDHDTHGATIVEQLLQGTMTPKEIDIIVEGMTKRLWTYNSNEPLSRYNHDINSLPETLKTKDIQREKPGNVYGQIAAIADKIAINIGDCIDAIRVNRLDIHDVLNTVPFVGDIFQQKISYYYNRYIAQESNLLVSKSIFTDMIINNKDTQSMLLGVIQEEIINTMICDAIVTSKGKQIMAFSDQADKQMHDFYKLCQNKCFPKTQHLESLMDAIIHKLMVSHELLPDTLQKRLKKLPRTQDHEKQVFMIVREYIISLTDTQAHEFAKQHLSDYYNKHVLPHEFVFHTKGSTQKLEELLQQKIIALEGSMNQNKYYAQYIDPETATNIVAQKGVEVISNANKFVVPVPVKGDTIQIPYSGSYKNGEAFRKGQPILDEDGKYYAGEGVVFFNSISDQRLVATSGLPGNDRHVTIINEPNTEQANLLQARLDVIDGGPENISIKEYNDIIEYARTMGLTDIYPSSVEYVTNKLIISKDSIYGLSKRKPEGGVKAMRILGSVELPTKRGDYQKYPNGGVIIHREGYSPHIAQTGIFLRTYTDKHGCAIDINKLPVYKQTNSKLSTEHLPVNKKKYHVSIVGCGISGIAATKNIVKDFLQTTDGYVDLEITIIDSSHNIGGPTYNRPGSSTIGMANSIKHLGLAQAQEIVQYLNQDPEYWQGLVPNMKYDATTGFDPNFIITHNQFGFIVKHIYNKFLGELQTENAPVSIKFIRNRVNEIRTHGDSGHIAVIQQGETPIAIKSDTIIIAIGNNLPKPLRDIHGNDLDGISGYYRLDDQAYMPQNLEKFGPDGMIGVAGVGNGALFGCLWAINNGYKGKFTLFSFAKTGTTPHTFLQSQPYERTILTLSHLAEHKKAGNKVTADYIKSLFDQEVALSGKTRYRRRDIIDSLFNETDAIRQLMDEKEQDLFMERYGKERLSMRYRIPDEHRSEIKKLITSGRIQIIYNYTGIESLGNERFLIHYNKDDEDLFVETSMIVNNTGPSKQLEEMPVLIKNMVNKGIARIHRYGGLDVNQDLEVSPGIFALGPIVSGAFLESMTVPAIRNHSHIVSKKVNNRIRSKYPTFHYSGYDHRPYDYSTMDSNKLSGEFKASRFAQSLTNIHPTHYDPLTKQRLFTEEFAVQALSKGDIKAPKDRTVLRSGGHIPGHPLGYGLGRIIAERYLVEQNAKIEHLGDRDQLYHTVAMTTAGLPVLNPMRDDPSVPYETKKKVTPHYILGFVKSAVGKVTLNVDDSDLDSFFREHEIQEFMNNPNITSVTIVRPSGDNLVELSYQTRYERYQAQRDQWTQSIISRYNIAKRNKDDGKQQKILYNRMSKALKQEIEYCKKNLNGDDLIIKYHKTIQQEYTKNKRAQDQSNENTRIQILTQTLGE